MRIDLPDDYIANLEGTGEAEGFTEGLPGSASSRSMQTGSPTLGVRLPGGSHRMLEEVTGLASRFGDERTAANDGYGRPMNPVSAVRSKLIEVSISGAVPPGLRALGAQIHDGVAQMSREVVVGTGPAY